MGKNEEIKKLLSEEELNNVAGGTKKKFYKTQCLICYAGCDWAREQAIEEFKEEHTEQTGHDNYHTIWRW